VSNVVPLRPGLSDDDHARLRLFFDSVNEAAHKYDVLAYVVSAMHAPDDDRRCTHADGFLVSETRAGVTFETSAQSLIDVASNLMDDLLSLNEDGGK
jgi:hypothetical protein